MKDRVLTLFFGTLAIVAGAGVNYFGDRLLGIRLELFWGVSTFSPLWILDLFAVPFIAGIVVSMVYGLGGKILCYFAPLLLRGFSYFDLIYGGGPPDGATVLPFAYWVLVLIVAVEAAAFGGVAGEIFIKKTYGRRPRHMVYKDRSNDSSSNS